MAVTGLGTRPGGLLASALLALASAPTPASGATFTGLGDLAGGGYFSIPYGVSADGSTVVGKSDGATGTEAFRWTSGGGMVGLGDLPGGTAFSIANAVSADGSVVVGYSVMSLGYEPFRWTSGGGMVALGDLAGGTHDTRAYGVSADGSVVVGSGSSTSGGEAFRWTSGGGMIGLGYLPGGSLSSGAKGVSADGSVVVGSSNIPPLLTEAFRWTSGGGMVGLGMFVSGGNSFARGVSADGLAIVGASTSGAGAEAFRWTSGGGMVGLGDLPGGPFASTAIAASADGSVVVGHSSVATGFNVFIWDQANGMRALDQVLNYRGVDLTGWTLKEAGGISADGTIIVGYGDHAGFGQEAWIVDLSGPSSPPLAPLGPETGIGVALALGALGYVAQLRATKRRRSQAAASPNRHESVSASSDRRLPSRPSAALVAFVARPRECVGVVGFEPTTLTSQRSGSSR